MENTQMPSLQDVYLLAIAACCEAEKLQTVMQQTGEGTGRLWLMREGTTIPQAWIGFKFNTDDVALKIVTRTEREDSEVVAYAAGLDAFLPRIQKCLREGMLADMSKAKSKRAA